MSKRIYSIEEMSAVLQEYDIMYKAVEGTQCVDVLPAQSQLAKIALAADYMKHENDSKFFKPKELVRRFAKSFVMEKGKGILATDRIYFDWV